MLRRALGKTRGESRHVSLRVEQLEERLVLSHLPTLSVGEWSAIGPAPVSGPGNLFGAQAGQVSAFAPHPTDPNTVYIAASNGGVWKTANWQSASPTWTPLTDSQPSLEFGSNTLVVSRSNPNVIYAAANGPGAGVLKSTDGGSAWTVLGGGLFDGAEFGAVVVSPGDANTVYVATCDAAATDGVFKSTDGGVNWTNITVGIHAGCVSHLAMDPTNPGILFAGLVADPLSLTDGLYKTTNAGFSWTRLSGGLPIGAPIGEHIAVTIAPSTTQTVYTTIFDSATGLPARFRSLNGGTSWAPLSQLPTPDDLRTSHTTLTAEPTNALTVFVNGNEALYRSTDGGTNWLRIMISDPVQAAFDATGGLVVVGDQGVYRSTDGGATWSNRQGNLQIAGTRDIAFDPTDPELAYGVAEHFGSYLGSTGTSAWFQFAAGGELGKVVVHATNPQVLYGFNPGEPDFFLRSNDRGISWLPRNTGIVTTEINSSSDAADVQRSLTIDASNPDHLLLGARRVYETTNRGDTWTPISAELSPGQRITSLKFAPSDNRVAYAGTTDGRFFASADGGRTWTPRDAGLPAAQTWDIDVDPTNAGRLYIVQENVANASVWFSANGGLTWTNVGGDLPVVFSARTIAVDWRIPTPVLYAGTQRGLYRSIDAGTSWSRDFAAGLPHVEVLDLEILSIQNVLAAGTFGRGVFELLVPPFTASVPDLLDADDSGGSPADNLTRVVRPRFTGRGWPDAASVVLVEEGIVIGTGSVDPATGLWTAAVAADLDDGPHAITARVIHPAGHISLESSPFVFVIDTTAPAAPVPPDLDAASDSGESSIDNLTADLTPRVSGTAEAGSIVSVFSSAAGPLGFAAAAAGTWNFTSGPLLDGTHAITVTATDAAGNTSDFSLPLVIMIDTTPPAEVSAAPDLVANSDSGASSSDGLTNDSTPTLVGSATADSSIVIQSNAALIGQTRTDSFGNWTITTSVLTDRLYDITARLVDGAGNLGPLSPPLTVIVDTAIAVPSFPDMTAASDTGTSNTDDVTRVSQPVFVGTSEPFSVVTLFSDIAGQVGQAAAGSQGDWTISTAPLVNGPHRVSATATDPAGNASVPTGMLPIRIDTAAPAPPTALDLVAENDSGLSNNDNITNHRTPLIFGIAEPNSRVTISSSLAGVLATGMVGTSGFWSLVSPLLASGVHTFTATASDAAGNASGNSTALVVTIDATAPSAPSIPDLTASSDSGSSDADDLTRDTNPVLAGTAEPFSTLSLIVDGIVTGTTTTDAAGVWRLASAMVTDGPHAVSARAADAAGNLSAASPALMVVIDTAAAAPAMPDLDPASDSGLFDTDNITADSTAQLRGTAEPGSPVTVLDGPLTLGVTVADGAGNWSFITSPLDDGPHLLAARTTDRAGNESAPSNRLMLVVDTTPPAAPSIVLVSDSGVAGDLRTNDRRPRIVGTAEPNSRVELLSGFDVLGTAAADVGGSFSVLPNGNSPDGGYSLRVRAIDAAGNEAVSPAIGVTIDATGPRVVSLNAAGEIAIPISILVVTFDDDNLVDSQPGEPSFADSVLNPANFSLVGSGGDGIFGNGNDRAVLLVTSDFTYDAAADQLEIRLRDLAGAPAALANDAYRFTVNGTTSLRDVAGNQLAGGDFVSGFSVAIPSPAVANVTLFDNGRSLTQIVVAFTQPLAAESVADVTNFRLVSSGKDKKLGTRDDQIVSVGAPAYDAAARTVTITPAGTLQLGRLHQLMVRDSLVGSAGSPLDGDADGNPGGEFSVSLGRGRSVSYQDRDGDNVSLSVLGAGTIDLLWSPADTGPRVRLSKTIVGVSTLSGNVKKTRGGNGNATLQSISPAGAVLLRLPSTFRITDPPIAALVDAVLESE